MPQANNKLYEILGKKPQLVQRADPFWPLPDTFMGVEIEIEGVDQRNINGKIDGRWSIVPDHSLRGGEEWVLASPLLGVSLREAISWFFKNVTGYKITTRTSTHIHINMMDSETDGSTLRNMLGVYIAAEDYFFRVAGEDRKWGGYCAPLEEAPVDLLAAMIAVPLNSDKLYRALKAKRANADRYYALNLLSLEKHGTFEFRHFPCTVKEEDVTKWIRMVMGLKLAAINMTKEGVDAFAMLSTAENVPVTLNKYIPNMAHEILMSCDAHRIASKINAVYTYSNNNVAGVRYDATKDGVLKSWIEKQGKKVLDLEDEDAMILALQKRKKVWAKAVGLEQDMNAVLANIDAHIRHNKNRLAAGVPEAMVHIDRYTRVFQGMDMLPPDQRRLMMERFPAPEKDFRARFGVQGLADLMREKLAIEEQEEPTEDAPEGQPQEELAGGYWMRNPAVLNNAAIPAPLPVNGDAFADQMTFAVTKVTNAAFKTKKTFS